MANTANSDGGTVVTIAANSIWKGTITLSATLGVAVGGTSATQYPSVTVSGANSSWANGDTVIKLALFVPAVGVTSLIGASTTASLSTGDIQVRTGANSVDLILNIGTGVTGVATAIGVIR